MMEAIEAIDQSDVEPIGRAVLLAVACGGVHLGKGRVAWVGSLPALVERSRVKLTAIKARLAAFQGAGILKAETVGGHEARVFDFYAIGRETTDPSREATGRETTDPGRETTDPKSGTLHATGAPSSLSEQISLKRELAVPRAPAHEPTHAHEAPAWSEAFTSSSAPAGTAGDPPPVVVAQQAWSEAFGVSQLPRRIDDAVAEALGTYPLDVVCQAADDLGAYLADHPGARPNLLRTPRCVADRCAKAQARAEAPAGRGRKAPFGPDTQPDRDSWGQPRPNSPFRLWQPSAPSAQPSPAAPQQPAQALSGWGPPPPRKDTP